MAIKQIFKNVRIWILIIALIFFIISIHPVLDPKGVAIRSVIKDSAAEIAGIENPKRNIIPTSKEIILSVNNQMINSVEEYNNIIKTIQPNQTVKINTNKNQYIFRTIPLENNLNETKIIGVKDIGIKVHEAPTSNIRKGIDLQGGTRVLLQPENKTSKEDLELIIQSIDKRLNVYGLSDINIRSASDLPVYLGGSGTEFIIVEIPGANEEEAKDLISTQGKFEAKISNETVFVGGIKKETGKKDIVYVCRSIDCSGIDSRQGCQKNNGQWFCRFRFAISLSPEAAQKQAEATKNLDVSPSETEMRYLSEPLQLFLDDELVDELNIAEDLKGKSVTDIEISGSGSGSTEQVAMQDTLNNMNELQTVLETGSLPVKLNIVKTDSISPNLGNEFIKNSIFFAVLAIIGVVLVIVIRYRKLIIAIPIIITMLSEILLLLGFAALIGWSFDLAAIAGIIIAVGTGVDDQIVITDETLKGEKKNYGLKERIKRAFFIIMASYFTTVVAMLPLLKAGAGLLRGFAFTTIVGVTLGVLITRPAFAAMVEILLKE